MEEPREPNEVKSSDGMSSLGDQTPAEEDEKTPELSQARKYLLLAVFSLGLFMDVMGFSVFFVLVGPLAEDLDVPADEQTWVITSFQVTFAAFLLFWGRVCDVFSAKPVFCVGFLGLGIINLIISFLPEKFSFFVFRALSGVAGSCLVPAAFRLIVQVFPPEELPMAFTVYGMSGSLANSMGLILGGVVQVIPGGGQMTSWRWYFRISAAIIIPVATAAVYLIPRMRHLSEEKLPRNKMLRKLDLPGAFLMFSATLLTILGLTLGASKGFNEPGFYVPLILGLAQVLGFFWYEATVDQDDALLPRAVWSTPNMVVWIVMGLLPYAWFGMNYIPLAEIFINVNRENPVIAAVRTLPEAVSCIVAAVVLTWLPILSLKPRITMPVCLIASMVAYILWIFSRSQVGTDYWRFVFPAMAFGGGAMHTVFNCINVGIMTSVNPRYSAVAGAFLQAVHQVGSAAGISIQAGLWTVYPGGYYDFRNVQVSWWFGVGWIFVSGIVFMVFYRRPKAPA